MTIRRRGRRAGSPVISLVNVVYGSLATMVIVLISMEFAAIIVLLGAQVIAELEHSSKEDVPWF